MIPPNSNFLPEIVAYGISQYDSTWIPLQSVLQDGSKAHFVFWTFEIPNLSNGRNKIRSWLPEKFQVIDTTGGVVTEIKQRNQRSAFFLWCFFFSGTFALPGVEPLSRANEKQQKERD